jgi:Transglycosylase SLT domain
MLALLLTLPAALGHVDPGHATTREEPSSTPLVDPDCDLEKARAGVCVIDPDCDPQIAREAEPSLVGDPDGVCPARGAQSPGGSDAGPDGQRDERTGESTPSTKGGEDQRGSGNRRKLRPKERQSREPKGGAKSQPRDKGKRRRRRRTSRRDPDPAPAPNTPGVIAGPPRPDSPHVHNSATPESRIPGFLLPIYRAAGSRYGVRWEILAAINEIESDYGDNLNVSSAGALGWMQFMPGTWRAYGVDADDDGTKDPYAAVDAIFAAARYLRAAGYEHDVRGAIYAYNHAWWYVDSVMSRARRIAEEYLSPPRVRRLDARFASRLLRIASRSGVAWELMLAVLRARGKDGAAPATRAQLRALARRLVRLGARRHPRRAARRLALARAFAAEPRLMRRGPSFADRVVALMYYNRSVGLRGLVRGLRAVKPALARQVLRNRRLEIYPGGRADIRNGRIAARVLLLLDYLSRRYREVTVTSLKTGHSHLTASGNVSAHSYGRAVDVAALNGAPILGNQERGGLTESALWRILLLPDEVAPDQLISLFRLGGPSFALDDHADHIHAGY